MIFPYLSIVATDGLLEENVKYFSAFSGLYSLIPSFGLIVSPIPTFLPLVATSSGSLKPTPPAYSSLYWAFTVYFFEVLKQSAPFEEANGVFEVTVIVTFPAFRGVMVPFSSMVATDGSLDT